MAMSFCFSLGAVALIFQTLPAFELLLTRLHFQNTSFNRRFTVNPMSLHRRKANIDGKRTVYRAYTDGHPLKNTNIYPNFKLQKSQSKTKDLVIIFLLQHLIILKITQKPLSQRA
jgi:hypothetical protein